ncbi:hypothetical protein WJX72_005746 [[Myrmecia] bisecta]|uniref:Uncharacterized protein n=1 Tax=[Myrmecia] bisecta TaxID=41462 RepID=A0AAW1R719_9CHLO
MRCTKWLGPAFEAGKVRRSLSRCSPSQLPAQSRGLAAWMVCPWLSLGAARTSSWPVSTCLVWTAWSRP